MSGCECIGLGLRGTPEAAVQQWLKAGWALSAQPAPRFRSASQHRATPMMSPLWVRSAVHLIFLEAHIDVRDGSLETSFYNHKPCKGSPCKETVQRRPEIYKIIHHKTCKKHLHEGCVSTTFEEIRFSY